MGIQRTREAAARPGKGAVDPVELVELTELMEHLTTRIRTLYGLSLDEGGRTAQSLVFCTVCSVRSTTSTLESPWWADETAPRGDHERKMQRRAFERALTRAALAEPR